MQGFNIQFYCRSCKKTKNGQAPLELSVNINGTRKFINLPFKTTPEEFHRKRQPKAITDYIALMRERINVILTEMLRNGEPVTTQALIEYVKTGGYKAYSVKNLFEDYLEILRARVGKNLSKGNCRKYELVKELFFEFVNPDGECEKELTHASVLRFKAAVEGKYEQATAAGYLRKLKSYIYFAIDNGKLSTNPFQGIKIKRGEKPIVYLKEWEVQLLLNTRIDNESLERVRDCAILQMSTGMAYADLKNFRKSDVKCKDGIYYIEKPRQKTGKVFTAVILKEGLEVLEKYDEMPVITNEKYNLFLKTLQGLCGINTTLTTHVFRRTYANKLLNSGIRYEAVAAAMGHDVKTCAKYYARMQESTVLAEIADKII